MIYTIGTQRIRTPETGPTHNSRTPRQSVPWRDVAESCRTLDAVCRQVPSPVRTAGDAVAKIGFWAAVFRNLWPECELVLNETDAEARQVLRSNFPSNVRIFKKDINDWHPPKCDVGLVDGDHFTLRLLPKWEQALTHWADSCRYLVVSDSGCFGFKFGNLKHYGVQTPEAYYKLLGRELRKITGKHVSHISKFENAAALLLGPDRVRAPTYLPPSEMKLVRGGQTYHAPAAKAKRLSTLWDTIGPK